MVAWTWVALIFHTGGDDEGVVVILAPGMALAVPARYLVEGNEPLRQPVAGEPRVTMYHCGGGAVPGRRTALYCDFESPLTFAEVITVAQTNAARPQRRGFGRKGRPYALEANHPWQGGRAEGPGPGRRMGYALGRRGRPSGSADAWVEE